MKKIIFSTLLLGLLTVGVYAATNTKTQTKTFTMGNDTYTLTRTYTDEACPVCPVCEPCVCEEEEPEPIEPEPVIVPDTCGNDDYCWHKDIQVTEEWIGEGIGGGSTYDNALSCWDDKWEEHYGCYDDPYCREGSYPCGCAPKENPFYVCLPYGTNKVYGPDGVVMKNRWVEIEFNGKVVGAQWEDCGPYVYTDDDYVFDCARPQNRRANGTGMDVSPAVWEYLGLYGTNNDDRRNKVDWRFIDRECLSDGPWFDIITTSGIYWR